MDDFTARVIEFFQIIHPLDRIPRAGYVMRGVTEPESVSAHSHFLAVLTLLYCEARPGEYDLGRALAIAVVHDLPEARLMDIPMPYADAYMKEAKQRAESALMADMAAGLPGNLPSLHTEFEQSATPEGRLVRALDKAQMMLKVLNYEREHRGCLDEFWGNPRNFEDYGVAGAGALFDAICERAGRARPR
ncbi:MAG: HD domain-containing protein [Candidatus Hydrogenedentes bacterium]|nr:HD domain-containing protein [Candidatus Hydrogenedentota bacterium]